MSYPSTARAKRGLFSFVLLLAAAVTLIALSIAPERASAFMYNTSGPTSSNTVLSTPSGLSMTASYGGSANRGSTFSASGHVSVPNNTFFPTNVPSSTGSSSSPSVISSTVDLVGCTSSSTPADCNLNRSLKLAFSRPVIGPIFYISGIGGYNTTSSKLNRYHLEGVVQSSSPAGVHLSAALGNPVNAKVANDRWGAVNDILGVQCTAPYNGGSPAGCLSTRFTGPAVSSLTFDLLARAYRESGTATLGTGAEDAIRISASYAQDFSSAPASYNGTQAPTHAITDLRLGTQVTEDAAGELNPKNSPIAVAPGENADVDPDADAVPVWPAITTGSAGDAYSVVVPISGASSGGNVCGWIDFNNNGTFDSGERACASFVSGAANVALNWTVPANVTAGITYARLRASYNTTQAQSPTGVADSGEVEDYTLAVMPEVTVKKELSSPFAGDKFDLMIGNTTFATNVGDGGSTGAKTLFHTSDYGAPDITVGQNIKNAAIPFIARETASGSNQGSYTSRWNCKEADGNTASSDSGTTTSGTSLPKTNNGNGKKQNVTCTFQNALDPAKPAFTSPGNNTVVQSDTPQFTGSSQPGLTITLYNEDGDPICTTTADAAGAWSCTPSTALDTGSQKIYVDATWTAPWTSNTSPRAELNITVDTTVYDIKITSPAPNSLITEDNPTITGTADDGGHPVLVIVTIPDPNGGPGDTLEVCQTMTDGAGHWSCVSDLDFSDKDVVPDGGSLPITAELVVTTPGDPANPTDTTTVNVSTAQPTIEIDGPQGLLFTNTPEVHGTTTEAPEGSVVVVTIDDPGNPGQKLTLCTTTVDSSGAWSCTVSGSTPLPEGPVEISATVTHKDNGKTADDTTDTVIVDTTPVNVTIDGPSGMIDTPTPDITGTSDAPAGSTVTVTIPGPGGSTVQICTAAVGLGGGWSCDGNDLDNPLPTGEQTLTATVVAEDSEGNTKSAIDTTNVDVVAPPTIDISGPADGSTVKTNTPDIDGSADAPEGSEVVVQFEDPDNPGSFIDLCTTTVDAEGGWSCEGSELENPLPEGPVEITATVTDPFGRTDADATSITVNTEALNITIDGPSGPIDTNTPDITGVSNAPDGSPVVVTIDDPDNPGTPLTLCTTTVTDHAWSCPGSSLSEPLPDGFVTITATVTDDGDTATDTTDVQVESGPPVVVIDGPSGLINTATPDITGTSDAPDSSTVVVTVPDPDNPGSTLFVCDATVVGGVWSCDGGDLVNPLPEGPVTLTATVTTPAGYTSDDTSDVFVYPGPPAVVISGPAGTINTPTPNISGTSNTPDGSEITVTYNDGIGDIVLCTTTVLNHAWSCPGASLDNPLLPGEQTITATVEDPFGATATDTSVVDVDTLAPSIEIDGPSGLINDNRPEIHGTTDPATTPVGSAVAVTIPGPNGSTITVCSTTVKPDNSWSCDPAVDLPEGPVTITAKVTHLTNSRTATDTTQVTVDTIAPTITINGPSGLVTEPRPNINGVTGDAPKGSPVVVTMPDPDHPGQQITVCTTTTSASGAWNCNAQVDLPEGPLTLTATVTDPAGNSADDTTDIDVDTIAPTIEIDGPSGLINQTRPNIHGTSGDAPEGSPVVVTIPGPGGSTITVCTTTVAADGSWNCNPGVDLPQGEVEIKAKVTRLSNNKTATDTTDVEVDSIAPTIEITGPYGPINDKTPTIVGTSDAPEGSVVTVTIPGPGGSPITLCTATVDEHGDWQCDSTVPLADGAVRISATVEDPAGNKATDDTDVVIDTISPEITIDGPSGNTTDHTPTISGTTKGAPTGSPIVVTMPDPANPGQQITVCTTTVQPGGVWSCQATSPLPDGPVRLTAQVTDEAGNKATDKTDLRLYPVDPDVVITGPSGKVDGPRPLVTGSSTAMPGTPVVVTVNDPKQPGTTRTLCEPAPLVQPDGSWSCTPVIDLVGNDIQITGTINGGKPNQRTSSTVVNIPAPDPSQCMKTGITITDMAPKGKRATMRGFARIDYAGQTVTVRRKQNPKKVIGKGKVQADGTFVVKFNAPARKLWDTNKALYNATVAKEKTKWTKLLRRVRTASVSFKNGKLRVTGDLVKPLQPNAKAIITAKAGCAGKMKQVGSTRVKKNGTFSATVSMPNATGVLFVRVKTTVRKGTKSKNTMTTYSYLMPLSITN